MSYYERKMALYHAEGALCHKIEDLFEKACALCEKKFVSVFSSIQNTAGMRIDGKVAMSRNDL